MTIFKCWCPSLMLMTKMAKAVIDISHLWQMTCPHKISSATFVTNIDTVYQQSTKTKLWYWIFKNFKSLKNKFLILEMMHSTKSISFIRFKGFQLSMSWIWLFQFFWCSFCQFLYFIYQQACVHQPWKSTRWRSLW